MDWETADRETCLTLCDWQAAEIIVETNPPAYKFARHGVAPFPQYQYFLNRINAIRMKLKVANLGDKTEERRRSYLAAIQANEFVRAASQTKEFQRLKIIFKSRLVDWEFNLKLWSLMAKAGAIREKYENSHEPNYPSSTDLEGLLALASSLERESHSLLGDLQEAEAVHKRAQQIRVALTKRRDGYRKPYARGKIDRDVLGREFVKSASWFVKHDLDSRSKKALIALASFAKYQINEKQLEKILDITPLKPLIDNDLRMALPFL